MDATLIALNIFNTFNWKKKTAYINALFDSTKT